MKDVTLLALKAEIQDRMHVRAERQILNHEVNIDRCEKIHNEIDDDMGVYNVFTDAVEKDSYAVIIVTEKEEVDNNIELEQISSRDLSMTSVQDNLSEVSCGRKKR